MAGVFADPSTAVPEAGPRRPEGPGGILRFEPTPLTGPMTGRSVVVLDTTWTAPGDADDPALGLRDVAERVLGSRDLNAESAEVLDTWAETSGIVDAMTVAGTSFWYNGRVGHAMWLREQMLWLGILDELVTTLRPSGIECAVGSDAELVQLAEMVAGRDGLAFDAERPPAPEPPADRTVEAAGRPSLIQRIRGRIQRQLRPDERTRRGRVVIERLDRLARSEHRPLLVVHAHALQRVDGPDGPRFMDAYLDPIGEHLAGSRLEPVTIDLPASIDDDETWQRLAGPGSERILPADVLRLLGTPDDLEGIRGRADDVGDRIAELTVPVIVSGVDVGPVLAARVAAQARRLVASRTISMWRIERLLRRLRPAGLLLADEYHRQDWLAAAKSAGVPTVAIQHGLIYRWHNGYIHRSRPAALRLPDRTYVFGPWERRLLTSHSVYREDEVIVGGSPRLDLLAPEPVPRQAIRDELDIAPGDRLVVISGTWGLTYRRFHYPLSLARLFDRPFPLTHLVVKLHPTEPDEGPYRAVIAGVAAAGGFDAPPISVVRTIDLYRLLGAADAHLGVQSTVLTEAVAAGTPNLLADTIAGADLLGYVAAGVAVPVRTGADVLAALDAPAAGETAEMARRAFLADHFEPGDASSRIATGLLEWLP